MNCILTTLAPLFWLTLAQKSLKFEHTSTTRRSGQRIHWHPEHHWNTSRPPVGNVKIAHNSIMTCTCTHHEAFYPSASPVHSSKRQGDRSRLDNLHRDLALTLPGPLKSSERRNRSIESATRIPTRAQYILRCEPSLVTLRTSSRRSVTKSIPISALTPSSLQR